MDAATLFFFGLVFRFLCHIEVVQNVRVDDCSYIFDRIKYVLHVNTDNNILRRNTFSLFLERVTELI